MKGFLKIIAILAIVALVIIGILFVTDIVSSEATKEVLTKVIWVLAIVAVGGLATSVLVKPTQGDN